MNTMADRLIEAMTKSAARQYGKERVTELAHALQCAELAAGAGGDEEMVLACLLHDVGRYAVAQEEIGDTLGAGASRATKARGHHEAGADLIAPYVPERVTFLVRAHADAKSVATQPWWPDALRLRRWDDEAKIVGKATRPLSTWGPLLRKYFADSR